MNTREKFSAGLICIAVVLAFLPDTAKLSFRVKPSELLPELTDPGSYVSVDQVARFIVSEDTTVTIVDVRPPEDFMKTSLPGSINIPYNELVDKGPYSLLNGSNRRIIFYANGDIESNLAYAYARGMKFRKCFVMKGGLHEWNNIVLNSSFTGEKISARENALYEARTRAKKMFNDLNSMPDSLKAKYLLSKRTAAKKLDGGCE